MTLVCFLGIIWFTNKEVLYILIGITCSLSVQFTVLVVYSDHFQLQSPTNPSYGDSIVPRISATSALLSSAVPPTTVCTAATSAREMKEKTTLQKQDVKSTPLKHGMLDKLIAMSPNMSSASDFQPLSSKSKESVIKTENSSSIQSTAVSSFHGQSSSTLPKSSQTLAKREPSSSLFQTPITTSHNSAGTAPHVMNPPPNVLKSSIGPAGEFIYDINILKLMYIRCHLSICPAFPVITYLSKNEKSLIWLLRPPLEKSTFLTSSGF